MKLVSIPLEAVRAQVESRRTLVTVISVSVVFLFRQSVERFLAAVTPPFRFVSLVDVAGVPQS